GQTISELGSEIGGTALPLAAVLVLKATPVQMGLLAAISTAPVLVVGLPAGAWVDRLRRRPILITADVGRAVLLGSIPLAALLHAPEPPPERPQQRQSLGHDVAEGLRMVLRHPVLRALAGSSGTFNFFGNIVGALYFLYAIRALGVPPGAVGLLAAAGGVSAF